MFTCLIILHCTEDLLAILRYEIVLTYVFSFFFFHITHKIIISFMFAPYIIIFLFNCVTVVII